MKAQLSKGSRQTTARQAHFFAWILVGVQDDVGVSVVEFAVLVLGPVGHLLGGEVGGEVCLQVHVTRKTGTCRP